MHWLLLVGGEALRPSGRCNHRAILQHCSSEQLGYTIVESFRILYSFPDGFEPPSPHLKTWALGFQIHDQLLIEEKLLPKIKNRMELLNIPWKYEAFYEDEPEGSKHYNFFSREKCMAWLQSIADQMLDSKVEVKIALYEFSDRPEGFAVQTFPKVRRTYEVARLLVFL